MSIESRDSPKSVTWLGFSYEIPEEPIKHEEAYAWEKPEWTKRSSLRRTKEGDLVKMAESLDKPITFPIKREDSCINREADPNILRISMRGNLIRCGDDLEEPITMNADDSKRQRISWEIPDWVKRPSLKSTSMGESARKGMNLERKITPPSTNSQIMPTCGENIPPNSSKFPTTNDENSQVETISWEKLDWTNRPSLKSTNLGESMRKGMKLESEITHVNAVKKEAGSNKEIGWGKPNWTGGHRLLKKTKKRRVTWHDSRYSNTHNSTQW